MTDIAQPARPAAESEVVPAFAGTGSTAGQLAAAAQAFKAAVGQGEPDDRPRDMHGRFTAAPDEGGGEDPGSRSGTSEIEAAADPGPGSGEAGAESPEESGDDPEAADEAQPEELPLPASWPAEQAELWRALPPEAQAVIAAREGQRDAAVNAKFQEAANLRKAHEAEINEAQSNRQRYAEAVDQVLSLVVPQPPPRTMLDRNSDDYDPDAYHYRKALYEDTIAFLNSHAHQRRHISAQEDMARFSALNTATRDAFMKSVPDIADQAKAPALFNELIDYAVSLGTPAETFDAPTTALEWHVLWKAREYDRLQAAKAKIDKDPKPEPRKPQPAVRPGVATPRGAVEQQQRGKALERLRQDGSVQAGADALKHLLKGSLGNG